MGNRVGDPVDHEPKLQVIILGSGGGPTESNVTAFLVRSTSTKWERGSLLAVDGGVHLSSIVNVLASHPPYSVSSSTHPLGPHPQTSATASPNIDDLPSPPSPIILTEGPFKGLELPHQTKEANAGWITRNLVDTFLITHPHLDHISGFVVNTAGLGGSRPKRLAGLPGTVEAFKNHIFNNVIWPNLSDENNGAGLVTYMRLVEGGSLAIGDGPGRGYVEVCEGLSVKTWSVSHGHCIENHPHGGTSRRSSSPGASFDALSPPHQSHSHASLAQQQQRRPSASFAPRKRSVSSILRTDSFPQPPTSVCVYDSSAYFIRSLSSSHEVLIFGDVEPDSISLSPRNKQVWSDAAPKIAKGLLRGIFIECSYTDEQAEETLFGHQAPRYLMQELKVLGEEVDLYKRGETSGETLSERERKKRKRFSNGSAGPDQASGGRRRSSRNLVADNGLSSSPVRPLFDSSVPLSTGAEELMSPKSNDGNVFPLRSQTTKPLIGVKIVLIHVKDRLDDGPPATETILRELNEYEEEMQLGCEFVIAKSGSSVYL